MSVQFQPPGFAQKLTLVPGVMEEGQPQRAQRAGGARCPPAMYDKWHHPPAACWGKDMIITRSPFIAPQNSFKFEDEEVFEQERTGDMEEERARSNTVTTTSSSYSEAFSSGASLSYDGTFLRSPPGVLLLAELVFGFLVWALIAGSEYFLFPTFGWVMFVAVFSWVLTAFLFIIYITRAHTRISKVPWTLVGLCFNGSASVLYLIAAIVDATSIARDHPRHHNYNSWTASAFFAFLVTICYGGSTYFSFRSWRTRS
ncbi:CKLF-like MARVEL transmembrane domain-containing protein 8 isoform X1 [Hyla sarda]|uniref:CKLF-like MARVEL transmembrane domain-containing protein 8 isoform X1 n=1 Tax=Hyla sarda TaxID=327740 RepID=UPI0024C44AB5|nr:CKLF-like MARVEL transmembrane domain-containing protein 8 isoform X1 [Hyla sarda]